MNVRWLRCSTATPIDLSRVHPGARPAVRPADRSRQGDRPLAWTELLQGRIIAAQRVMVSCRFYEAAGPILPCRGTDFLGRVSFGKTPSTALQKCVGWALRLLCWKGDFKLRPHPPARRNGCPCRRRLRVRWVCTNRWWIQHRRRCQRRAPGSRCLGSAPSLALDQVYRSVYDPQ